MNLVLAIILPILSIVALMAAVHLVSRFGKKYAINPEVQRKIVHVMVGLFAMTLPFTFPNRWSVVALIIFALIAMLTMRFAPKSFGNAGDAIHSVERKSLGDIWLALAIGFLFLRSEGNYILFGLPMAIITLSDAAAALTGSVYGKRRFVTEGGAKSIEGVLAFVVVGWLAAMIMLLMFSDAARGNVIIIALVIAMFGAQVEAISWRGLDNLFVPLTIHFFLRYYLNASPMQLGIMVGLYVIGSILAFMLARRLKLAPFTANAFAVALFVFLGVGAIFGGIMPALAMGAYLATRKEVRGGGEHPALDFLATLCAAGLIWVFIDESVGRTAVHYYNLCMAGIGYCYAVLGLAARGKTKWAIFATPLVIGFCVLFANLPISFALAPKYYWLFCLAQFAALAAVCLMSGNFLRAWRAPKIALISAALPLLAFLFLDGLN